MPTLNNLRTSLSAVWSSISVTATFLTGLVIFAFAWAFNFTSLLTSLVLNHRLFNHRCCWLEMWHKRSGLNYSKGWVAELLTWHSRTLAFFTSGSFSFTSNSPTFWGKKGPLWSNQPSGSLQQFWGCEPTRRMISGINYSVNVQPGTWNCGITDFLCAIWNIHMKSVCKTGNSHSRSTKPHLKHAQQEEDQSSGLPPLRL